MSCCCCEVTILLLPATWVSHAAILSETSREHRENDYLWGRLHGAERMIDIVCSTLDEKLPRTARDAFKRDAFLAILDEESEAGRCSTMLLEQLRSEVRTRLP